MTTNATGATDGRGEAAQQLIDWAVLSTEFCRQTAIWISKGAPWGGHGEAQEAWIALDTFVHDEGLAPASHFDYSADSVDGLVPEGATEEDAQRYTLLRTEISDAAPVVREFRMLLSADTRSEYESDANRIRGAIETWVVNRAVSGGPGG